MNTPYFVNSGCGSTSATTKEFNLDISDAILTLVALPIVTFHFKYETTGGEDHLVPVLLLSSAKEDELFKTDRANWELPFVYNTSNQVFKWDVYTPSIAPPLLHSNSYTKWTIPINCSGYSTVGVYLCGYYTDGTNAYFGTYNHLTASPPFTGKSKVFIQQTYS